MVKLQNTGPLKIYISLNHNTFFCVLPFSSKHADKVDPSGPGMCSCSRKIFPVNSYVQ